MRKSLDFRILRHIVFATFLVPFATTGHAQEGVLRMEVERKIELVVTIEPHVLYFTRVQRLSTGPKFIFHKVLLVQLLEQSARADCRELFFDGSYLCHCSQYIIVDDMDGAPTISVTEAMAPFAAAIDSARDAAFFRHGDLITTTSHLVTHDSYEFDRFRRQGSETSHKVLAASIGGRCYHLNLLIQIKTADEKEDYGTVSAQFSIRAGAEIDFGEATYEVKVEATGPIVFDLDDEPEDPARRQQAIELFDEFKAGVIWQYETIIDELNIKRRLLNQKDLGDLRALAAGEPLFINKMITIDWYDEQKTVNVNIAATVADIDDPDGPTDQPMDFFESDEDWSYSPDAGSESEVVP